MTVDPSLTDLADGAAEAIRALNHRTLGGSGDLAVPSEVCGVLAALSALATRLPQLTQQLAAVLDRQLRDGQLIADGMTPADAAALVAAIRRSAQVAGCHANEFGRFLDAAHQAAAHLAIRGERAPPRLANPSRSRDLRRCQNATVQPGHGAGDEIGESTRAAVVDHVAAFNAHDTNRLLAGLYPDVLWATGSDVYRGSAQLRQDLFDDGLWAMRPSLEVRTLVVEGQQAAGVFWETLVVNDEPRGFDIAVFFTVHDALIRSVTVFREGTADIEP